MEAPGQRPRVVSGCQARVRQPAGRRLSGPAAARGPAAADPLLDVARALRASGAQGREDGSSVTLRVESVPHADAIAAASAATTTTSAPSVPEAQRAGLPE